MQEGIIKFKSLYLKTSPIESLVLEQLISARNTLKDLNLIGVTNNCVGFGNISMRLSFLFPYLGLQNSFVISGSQTGGINESEFNRYHLAIVLFYDSLTNECFSIGPREASSESPTHYAFYQADSDINCVIHVHSPVIYRNTEALNLPTALKNILYGTPEMHNFLLKMSKNAAIKKSKKLVMLGHEDGVLAWDGTPDLALRRMLILYQKAQCLERLSRKN